MRTVDMDTQVWHVTQRQEQAWAGQLTQIILSWSAIASICEHMTRVVRTKSFKQSFLTCQKIKSKSYHWGYISVLQRWLKMNCRRIRRIFVNSKILRRYSKIANSSNIFKDKKIFKGKWKILVVKNFLSGGNLDKFFQQ